MSLRQSRYASPLKHTRFRQRSCSGVRYMTICIAAIAGNGNEIVCVADKMLSFGELSQEYVQWDSNVTKMIPIQSGRCLALFAGSLPICREVIYEIDKLANISADIHWTEREIEKIYKTAFERNQRIEILQQRGLSKADYVSLLGSAGNNSAVLDIYEKMADYTLDCDLMLCGFDGNRTPFIISVGSPGLARNHQSPDGCHAIGIAATAARGRLLWSGFDSSHPFGRVLFDTFDAKASVEMKAGIGFDWDAQVMFQDDGCKTVPKPIKRDLIEAAWDMHCRSPFEEWNDEEYLSEPEPGWEKRILALSGKELNVSRD